MSPSAYCGFFRGKPSRGRLEYAPMACAAVFILFCFNSVLQSSAASNSLIGAHLGIGVLETGIANGVGEQEVPASAGDGSKDDHDASHATHTRPGRQLLSTLTAADQKEALLKIKIGFRNSSVLSDWSDDTLPCSAPWTFVTCTGSDVTKLIIQAQPALSGTLAPEIGSLSYLVSLMLKNLPAVSGVLPAGIASLTRLDTLQVYNLPALGGTIPEGLGTLSSMVNLDMSLNSLSGSIPESISPTNHVQIVMDLKSNQLTGTLPELASGLIQRMDFSGNSLSGTLSISKFSTMSQQIKLSSNRISGTIPSAMSGLNSLSTLNLGSNRLWGSIPSSMLTNALLTFELDNNLAICGSPPLLGTYANTRIPTACPYCLDTYADASADWNCDSTEPFCFNENLNTADQGNLAFGLTCVACLDSVNMSLPLGIDLGCNMDAPICREQHRYGGVFEQAYGGTLGTNDGDFEEGASCVECHDTDTGGGRDLGCSDDNPMCIGDQCRGCLDTSSGLTTDYGCQDQTDYLTGEFAAPLCYTGFANDGSGEPSVGIFGDDSNKRDLVCAVCFDDQSADTADIGCSATGDKFCLDWSPTGFNNDGDNGFGIMCLGCINDKSGDVKDTGCTDENKFCLPVQPMFVAAPGTDDPGFCVACLATPTDSDVDIGCSPARPRCLTTHTYRASVAFFAALNSTNFPISATAGCYVCEDDLIINNGTEVDRGCTAAQPYCVYGREEDTGFGLGCSEFPNPQCTFYEDDISNVVGTCPTLMAVQADVTVEFGNCTVLQFDLSPLAAEVAGILNVPPCRVSVSVQPAHHAHATTRRLLQDDTSAIQLLIQVAMANETEALPLLALLSGPEFEDTVAAFFEEIGNVVSLSAVFSIASLSSVTSDPHFVTAQGAKFDFNGVAGQSYCILTDANVQVNARFVGADASTSVVAAKALSADKPDTRTWMDQVAILYGGDHVLVEAASPPAARFAAATGTVRVNGEALEGRAFATRLASGVTISRKKTRLLITVPDVLEVEVEVVRAVFWEAGSGPGRNFLNLQVKQFNGTGAAHGILGQHFAGPVVGADIEGTPSDYATSGVLVSDCHFNRFKQARED
eukprot:jgi/Mesvir1/24669/Mv21963-RA.1